MQNGPLRHCSAGPGRGVWWAIWIRGTTRVTLKARRGYSGQAYGIPVDCEEIISLGMFIGCVVSGEPARVVECRFTPLGPSQHYSFTITGE